MTYERKKVVIFAPFWRMQNHVGNNRVERFIRWLNNDGCYVVVVCAGKVDSERQAAWGAEIAIRDVLTIYPEDRPNSPTNLSVRKPNKIRKTLSSILFNPDPGVVWARTAARHPSVLAAMADSCFILSSSPPESVHVGAWMLSRKSGVPHVVDLRDGWLDEPLKHSLHSSYLRRWREGRLEARILRDAAVIQVTSDAWKVLLCQRLPELSARVKVLTNGYPQHMPEMVEVEKSVAKDGLLLIHAGRFSGSDTRRTPDLLLQPLLEAVTQQSSSGVIQLLGSLSAEEQTIIDKYKALFTSYGWAIDCPGSLPRYELLKRLHRADGLLLLSASYAAVPSKLYEYIPTGKPLFVVTQRDSAAWKICESLPQACLIHINESMHNKNKKYPLNYVEHTLAPIAYSDASLSLSFLDNLKHLSIP